MNQNKPCPVIDKSGIPLVKVVVKVVVVRGLIAVDESFGVFILRSMLGLKSVEPSGSPISHQHIVWCMQVMSVYRKWGNISQMASSKLL